MAAYPIKAPPPPATRRARVGAKLDLGIRAINQFTTCCAGQRMGIFAGSGVGKSTLLSMLAKNSDAQKSEDKSTSSSSCSAYQQAPDGSWEPLPCKETGERSQPQTQNRTSPQGADRGER
jgi:hypothetical protein